ncbi:hypothetical protein G3M48_007616 [Beauveria asiatica]|uniref:O-methyltransferase C-terminal domain-containing protein n=1 Tax=Beauveria asiatica TaxID=1069075 RepID=A0AAW0RMJ3_9HYPO
MGGLDQEQPVDPAMVLLPNNVDIIPSLIKDISDRAQAVIDGKYSSRQELVIMCRALAQAVETPRETMIRHCWAETGAMAAINFGIDCGLWALMARNGDGSQTVMDLAAALSVDAILLSRVMRHLAAMGYIAETGQEEYKPTNYSKALSLPVIGNGYLAILSCTGAAPLKFHEFSRQREWINPTDTNDTSLMHAYGTNMGTFNWLQHCGYGSHFNDHMAGRRLGRLPWMSPAFYPVQQRLVDGAITDPEAPFLVDIGGNVGHDLAEFRTMFPNVPGRLILQDLPIVISQITDLDPSIERMGYDVHDEQPVKGARAYYVHSLLNNFANATCERILGRIREAMRPGYSKLIINEFVMPTSDAFWETSALDMVMLTLFSGQERTMVAWRHLLEERAGLSIVKVWSGGKGVQDIIECELLPTDSAY